eukprot:scaffold22420_cov124-Isochrysis_galbana.AAC.8
MATIMRSASSGTCHSGTAALRSAPQPPQCDARASSQPWIKTSDRSGAESTRIRMATAASITATLIPGISVSSPCDCAVPSALRGRCGASTRVVWARECALNAMCAGCDEPSAPAPYAVGFKLDELRQDRHASLQHGWGAHRGTERGAGARAAGERHTSGVHTHAQRPHGVPMKRRPQPTGWGPRAQGKMGPAMAAMRCISPPGDWLVSGAIHLGRNGCTLGQPVPSLILGLRQRASREVRRPLPQARRPPGDRDGGRAATGFNTGPDISHSIESLEHLPGLRCRLQRWTTAPALGHASASDPIVSSHDPWYLPPETEGLTGHGCVGPPSLNTRANPPGSRSIGGEWRTCDLPVTNPTAKASRPAVRWTASGAAAVQKLALSSLLAHSSCTAGPSPSAEEAPLSAIREEPTLRSGAHSPASGASRRAGAPAPLLNRLLTRSSPVCHHRHPKSCCHHPLSGTPCPDWRGQCSTAWPMPGSGYFRGAPQPARVQSKHKYIQSEHAW